MVDKVSSRAGVITNLLIIVVMGGVSLWTIAINTYGFTTYAFTFMWGMQDGALNTHTYQMLGFEFESSSHPFSIYCIVQALGVVLF